MAGLATQPFAVIRPRPGWQAIDLADVWRYRDLILVMASRDLRLRYRQTALGVLWVVLQPLLSAAIFAFVFGRVARLPSGGTPYLVFAYAGLLGWNVFHATMTRTSTCLLQNAHLIAKSSFPRLVLPLAGTLPVLLDLVVSLVLIVPFMAYYRLPVTPAVLLLPVWIVAILMLSLGLGVWLSALMVKYRDVQYVVPVMTQVILYASPVAYAASAVPASLRRYFFLNPLAGLLEAFRWSLLRVEPLPMRPVLYGVGVAVVTCWAGLVLFRRGERGFADVI